MTGACRNNLSLGQLQDQSVPKLYLRGNGFLEGLGTQNHLEQVLSEVTKACANQQLLLSLLETSIYLLTPLHRIL